jgi:hypothetical protein
MAGTAGDSNIEAACKAEHVGGLLGFDGICRMRDEYADRAHGRGELD